MAAKSMREPIRDILLDILRRRLAEMVGFALAGAIALFALALVSWSVRDPSLNHAVDGPVRNWLGWPGAVAADVAVQLFGLSILAVLGPIFAWGFTLIRHRSLDRLFGRFGAYALGVLAASGFASLLPRADSWPLPTGLGGAVGDAIERLPLMIIGASGPAKIASALLFAVVAIVALHMATVRDPEVVRAEARRRSAGAGPAATTATLTTSRARRSSCWAPSSTAASSPPGQRRGPSAASARELAGRSPKPRAAPSRAPRATTRAPMRSRAAAACRPRRAMPDPTSVRSRVSSRPRVRRYPEPSRCGPRP